MDMAEWLTFGIVGEGCVLKGWMVQESTVCRARVYWGKRVSMAVSIYVIWHPDLA